MKRYLSVLLSVLMLLTMLPLGAIVASADGEYFTITENNRNLFVNVNQEIGLGDISVMINGVAKSGNEVIMKVVSIIMYYAPIGLFAYFAALVGEYGKEIIGSYARSMIFYYIIFLLLAQLLFGCIAIF